jgi:hypothetical protein
VAVAEGRVPEPKPIFIGLSTLAGTAAGAAGSFFSGPMPEPADWAWMGAGLALPAALTVALTTRRWLRLLLATIVGMIGFMVVLQGYALARGHGPFDLPMLKYFGPTYVCVAWSSLFLVLAFDVGLRTSSRFTMGLSYAIFGAISGGVYYVGTFAFDPGRALAPGLIMGALLWLGTLASRALDRKPPQ